MRYRNEKNKSSAGTFGCRLLSAIFMGIMSVLMMGCAMSPEQQVVERIHRAALLPSAKLVEVQVLAETLGVELGYHPGGSGDWRLESKTLIVGSESRIGIRTPPRDNAWAIQNIPNYLEHYRKEFGIDTDKSMLSVELDISKGQYCLGPSDVEFIFGTEYRLNALDDWSAHPTFVDGSKMFKYKGRPLAWMIYTLSTGPLRQVAFRFSYTNCVRFVIINENEPPLP